MRLKELAFATAILVGAEGCATTQPKTQKPIPHAPRASSMPLMSDSDLMNLGNEPHAPRASDMDVKDLEDKDFDKGDSLADARLKYGKKLFAILLSCADMAQKRDELNACVLGVGCDHVFPNAKDDDKQQLSVGVLRALDTKCVDAKAEAKGLNVPTNTPKNRGELKLEDF